MNTTNREELSEYLHTLRGLLLHCPGSAKMTGFMVSGIRDSADLWQEAQNAYGIEADGLMDLLADYGLLAETFRYYLSVHSQWGELVDEREANVETVFLWAVVEPFGEELAKLIRDSKGEFPRSVGVALLVGMVTDWLLGPEPVGPSENDRWIIDAGRTEPFYSECETLQEAIADCMDYYGLVSDAGIRKIERIG